MPLCFYICLSGHLRVCVYVYMCLDLALSMCGLSCCDVLYILISGKMGFYLSINRILLCLANFWLFLYFIFSRGSVSFFCCCSRPHLSDAKKKSDNGKQSPKQTVSKFSWFIDSRREDVIVQRSKRLSRLVTGRGVICKSGNDWF